MEGAHRGIRALTLVSVVGAVVVLFFAMVARASAQPTDLTITPADPVVGDTVTANGPGVECVNNAAATYTFTFALHNKDGTQTVTASGPGTSGSTGIDFSATVSQAGDYTVREDARCPDNTVTHTSLDFKVRRALNGTISVSPDPAVVNQAATISVTPDGGNGQYTEAWTVDGTAVAPVSPDSPFEVDYTFTTTGSHTVSVRISDNKQGTEPVTHTTTITRTINVVKPSSTGPPPPPPPPCIHRVAFKLSEFTTAGCFTQTSSSPARWQTRSAIKLNGIPFPGFGQTFVVAGPTAGDPGGHFTAPNSTMQLGEFTPFSGDIDWSLPDGGSGQEKVFHSFSVAFGGNLLGLDVRGSIALRLGEKDGAYYAKFPLSIQLPAAFTAGPDPRFGSVTGAASLRVDDTGIHYDGLQLAAQDVWLGKLKVNSVCFSYIPPNGAAAQCPTPTFGGTSELPAQPPGADQPFLQCNSDATTNRWDASADIEVPSGLEIGGFGGLANGQISKFGASIGNLGRRVPIADGVYLDHVSFGLCLSPPPFTIRANVGANFLGSRNLVSVDGGFTYTDATQTSPWSLELDGGVSVGTLPIGNGTLGINGAGGIDFGLDAGVNLSGAASLNAQVSGWIDAPHNQFVVSGSGQGCLGTTCADAEGEISSTGVAGCVTVGSSTPTYDLIIPLDGGPPHLDTSTYALTAGFGYVWGASAPDMLGGSCDFSPYEPVRAAEARVAGASASRLRVTRGTDAVALRIHGTNGPPKVVLRGPRGSTITSPSDAASALSKGHYLLVENKADGTTDVMLVRPAAGTWTVSQVPGSESSPTTIDRANLEAPPTFGARVRGKGGVRTVRAAYAVAPGSSVRLLERAKGINHMIAAHLRGRRCPGLPRLRPHTDEKILCANIRFRPALGPGGRREVQAVVTRRGIPLLQKNIASFRVPRQKLPSRVGKLRARRSRGSLVVAFARSRGASRYSISAMLSDGRELAFDLGGGCRAVRIASVPAGVAAAVKIAGVRYDLAMGRARRISIKANERSAGHTKKKWRPGKICT